MKKLFAALVLLGLVLAAGEVFAQACDFDTPCNLTVEGNCSKCWYKPTEDIFCSLQNATNYLWGTVSGIGGGAYSGGNPFAGINLICGTAYRGGKYYAACAKYYTAGVYTTCQAAGNPQIIDANNDGIQDPPPVADTDGDGILDNIDPFPNDPTPFQYRLHQSQKDQNGNLTWLRIITDRFTPAGTPITMSYGTYDGNAITITEIGAEEWLPSTNLAEQELTFSENETVNISPPPNIQTLTPGQDNTGNSAELDYLADIVSNTKATADNQAKNQIALEGIATGIGIGNKLLSELTAKGGSSGGSGSGSYPNQETKDGEIISQLQAMNDKLQDDAAGRSSMTSQAGQGGAHLANFKQGVTEEEKAGFGNDMDTSYTGAAMAWLRDFINDNPFSQGLLDSGIQASAGSCSMSFQVMNKTHTFNLCFMAPALQNAGTILLALTSMLALFVIVRQ